MNKRIFSALALTIVMLLSSCDKEEQTVEGISNQREEYVDLTLDVSADDGGESARAAYLLQPGAYPSLKGTFANQGTSTRPVLTMITNGLGFDATFARYKQVKDWKVEPNSQKQANRRLSYYGTIKLKNRDFPDGETRTLIAITGLTSEELSSDLSASGRMNLSFASAFNKVIRLEVGKANSEELNVPYIMSASVKRDGNKIKLVGTTPPQFRMKGVLVRANVTNESKQSVTFSSIRMLGASYSDVKINHTATFEHPYQTLERHEMEYKLSNSVTMRNAQSASFLFWLPTEAAEMLSYGHDGNKPWLIKPQLHKNSKGNIVFAMSEGARKNIQTAQDGKVLSWDVTLKPAPEIYKTWFGTSLKLYEQVKDDGVPNPRTMYIANREVQYYTVKEVKTLADSGKIPSGYFLPDAYHWVRYIPNSNTFVRFDQTSGYSRESLKYVDTKNVAHSNVYASTTKHPEYFKASKNGNILEGNSRFAYDTNTTFAVRFYDNAQHRCLMRWVYKENGNSMGNPNAVEISILPWDATAATTPSDKPRALTQEYWASKEANVKKITIPLLGYYNTSYDGMYGESGYYFMAIPKTFSLDTYGRNWFGYDGREGTDFRLELSPNRRKWATVDLYPDWTQSFRAPLLLMKEPML